MIVLIQVFQWAIDTSFLSSKEVNFDVALMYCSGALLEVMGEPWVNVFQSTSMYGPRLKAETMAVFVRSVVTFIAVVGFSLGVRGFGYAQIAYGATYFLTLLTFSGSFKVEGVSCSFSDFLPRLIAFRASDSGTNKRTQISNRVYTESNFIDLRTAGVAFTATFSSLLKHLLTEADKISLSLTTSTYNQGIFAVASNYGSLVARLIFLPIEESSRTTFSAMASELQGKSGTPSQKDASINSRVSKSSKENESHLPPVISAGRDVRRLMDMEDLLVMLVQIVSTLGVFFLIFGPLYSRVVVQLLFAKGYQSEESVRTLAAVCINVFFLALNGVLEAFVQASAPPSAFKRVNIGFVIGSMVYILSVGTLIRILGTCGLVLAGSLSMVVRILTSYAIIRDIFTIRNAPSAECSRTPGQLFCSLCRPPYQLLLVLLFSWILSYSSSERFFSSPRGTKNIIEHVAIGGIAFLFLVAAILMTLSNDNLQHILTLTRLKKKQA
jgi:oligosaccharide translocation protein RFT1